MEIGITSYKNIQTHHPRIILHVKIDWFQNKQNLIHFCNINHLYVINLDWGIAYEIDGATIVNRALNSCLSFYTNKDLFAFLVILTYIHSFIAH